MGQRRYIADGGHLNTHVAEGADGRLTTRTGAFHEYFGFAHAQVVGYFTAVAHRHLGGVGRVLLRTTEAHFAGRSPRNHLTVIVRNRDDDVVERGTDVYLAHLLHHDNALLGFVFSFLCHLVIAKDAGGVGAGYASALLVRASADSRLSLFSCLLLAGHGLTLALTGTRVVLGALTTNWQTFAVTQTTVAADIHQTLDVRCYFRAQYAFGLVLGSNDGADGTRLLVGPVLHLLIDIDASFYQNLAGVAPANAENVGQRNFAALVVRDINPCDTSHIGWLCVCGQKPGNYLEGGLEAINHQLSTQGSGVLKIELTLTLLKAGVFLVDNVEFAVATHNLAINATLFDGGFDFHF